MHRIMLLIAEILTLDSLSVIDSNIIELLSQLRIFFKRRYSKSKERIVGYQQKVNSLLYECLRKERVQIKNCYNIFTYVLKDLITRIHRKRRWLLTCHLTVRAEGIGSKVCCNFILVWDYSPLSHNVMRTTSNIMNFHQRRRDILTLLYTSQRKTETKDIPDKSLKRSIDRPIASCISSINQDDRFISTSCCSGRISIFVSDPQQKKNLGQFLYVAHYPVLLGIGNEDVLAYRASSPLGNSEELEMNRFSTVEDFIARLEAQLCKEHETTVYGNKPKTCFSKLSETNDVWFNVEPFIIHIECRDLEAAQFLLEIASFTGVKTCGIKGLPPQRIIVFMAGSNKMYVPIGKVNKERELCLSVSNDYLYDLLQTANNKMLYNFNQIRRFHEGFLSRLNNIMNIHVFLFERLFFSFSSLLTVAVSKDFFLCLTRHDDFSLAFYCRSTSVWGGFSSKTLPLITRIESLDIVVLRHDDNKFLVYDKSPAANSTLNVFIITLSMTKRLISWSEPITILIPQGDWKEGSSVHLYVKQNATEQLSVDGYMLYRSKRENLPLYARSFCIDPTIGIQSLRVNEKISIPHTVLTTQQETITKESNFKIWHEGNTMMGIRLPSATVVFNEFPEDLKTFYRRRENVDSWYPVPIAFSYVVDSPMSFINFMYDYRIVIGLYCPDGSRSMSYFSLHVEHDSSSRWVMWKDGFFVCTRKMDSPTTLCLNNTLDMTSAALFCLIVHRVDVGLIRNGLHDMGVLDMHRDTKPPLKLGLQELIGVKTLPVSTMLLMKHVGDHFDITENGLLCKIKINKLAVQSP